jgi:hypothetical protein
MSQCNSSTIIIIIKLKIKRSVILRKLNNLIGIFDLVFVNNKDKLNVLLSVLLYPCIGHTIEHLG